MSMETAWDSVPSSGCTTRNAATYSRTRKSTTCSTTQRRTYEDLFQKRYFSSYIVKEDNAFNRQIVSYARGLDALAESERIQQELFNIEHDIWNY